MTIKEKIARHLNEVSRDRLASAFRVRWGVEVETNFDILGSMRHITTRVDGEDFTPEQHAWIAAYMQGWEQCEMEATR